MLEALQHKWYLKSFNANGEYARPGFVNEETCMFYLSQNTVVTGHERNVSPFEFTFLLQ